MSMLYKLKRQKSKQTNTLRKGDENIQIICIKWKRKIMNKNENFYEKIIDPI